MITLVRFACNVVFTLLYILFLSQIDNFLKTFTVDTRILLILQGMAWLTITILVNSLTSKNPILFIKQRIMLIAFIFIFIYWAGSSVFFTTKLFTIANLEAYWFSLVLVNYGLYIAEITGRKLSSNVTENRDFIIYYLWMMLFIFCLFFPSLFTGPYIGVIIGPFLMVSLTIYTNRKGGRR